MQTIDESYEANRAEVDRLIEEALPSLRYQALQKLGKLDLINVRFNRFGELRMSRPCEKCMPWCKALFRSIWYTTDEGIFKVEEL